MSGRTQTRVGYVVLVAALMLTIVNGFLNYKVEWGDDYIAENLSAQQIVFPEAENPDGSPNEEVAASDCLTAFAGEQLSTGAQAECYANEYIGLHMRHSAEEATLTSEAAIAMNDGETSLAGSTYATLGKYARGLDPSTAETTAEAAAMEADIATASALRENLFRGELLRGTLLNAYGWGELVSIGAIAVMALWVVVAALGVGGIWLIATGTHKVRRQR